LPCWKQGIDALDSIRVLNHYRELLASLWLAMGSQRGFLLFLPNLDPACETGRADGYGHDEFVD